MQSLTYFMSLLKLCLPVKLQTDAFQLNAYNCADCNLLSLVNRKFTVTALAANGGRAAGLT